TRREADRGAPAQTTATPALPDQPRARGARAAERGNENERDRRAPVRRRRNRQDAHRLDPEKARRARPRDRRPPAGRALRNFSACVEKSQRERSAKSASPGNDLAA